MNIEDTIEELYSCLPGDRKKFNLIMEDMKKRFLRNVKNPNKNKTQQNQYKISFQPNRHPQYLQNISPKNNVNNKFDKINNLKYKPNIFNPYTNNPINTNIKETISSIKNEPNINYRPIKIQENINHYNTQRNFYPQPNRLNNIESNYRKKVSNGFHGTLPDALLINPKPLRTNSQQKLLSDTHANCNYYYPEKNSNIYDGDIDREGNGWHNQANNIMFNTSDNFFTGNK